MGAFRRLPGTHSIGHIVGSQYISPGTPNFPLFRDLSHTKRPNTIHVLDHQVLAGLGEIREIHAQHIALFDVVPVDLPHADTPLFLVFLLQALSITIPVVSMVLGDDIDPVFANLLGNELVAANLHFRIRSRFATHRQPRRVRKPDRCQRGRSSHT